MSPYSSPINHCRKIDCRANKRSSGKTCTQSDRTASCPVPKMCLLLCCLRIWDGVIGYASFSKWQNAFPEWGLFVCIREIKYFFPPEGWGSHYMHDANSKPCVRACVLLLCPCKKDESYCVGVYLKSWLKRIKDQQVGKKG